MAKPTKKQLAAEALARSLAHTAATPPAPFWYVMTDTASLPWIGSHLAARQLVTRQAIEAKGYPIFASEAEAKAYRDPIFARQQEEYHAANPGEAAVMRTISEMSRIDRAESAATAGDSSPTVSEAVAEAAERDETTPEPLRSKQIAGQPWHDDEDADHAIFGTH